jgi:hypothetical protein
MKTRRKTVSPAVRQIEPLESRRLLSTTLFVDATAPGATHDGSSWADAYTDLQSALHAATAGTTIEVAQGTYKPTTGTDRTVSFQLINGVTLEGGFAGNPAADPNVRDPANTPAILSGDIGTIGNNSDNSYSVVTSNQSDATAVIDGFTITGGNADVSVVGQAGGGMDINNGSPTVSDCIFHDNFGFYGGGLCSNTASPTITDCTFIHNSAGQGGGAGGGGIFQVYGSSKITNCAFIDNSSTNYGGGIDSGYQSTTLVNCTFTDNHGTTGEAYCDAYANGATFTNCILWGDSGSSEIVDALGNPTTTVTNSDIQGGHSGAGNINADPHFVDAASDNVMLQRNSPCINTGSNAAIPAGITTDLAGNPRISGGTVDMGAFEAPLRNNIITAQPADTVAGQTLAPIVVQLQNAAGAVLVNNNSNVTLSIASGPTGAILLGTTTVAAHAGVATFSNVQFDVAGTYQLMASGNLAGATSAQFTVSPAAASKLAIVQQPANTTAGVAISPAIAIDAEDRFGNLITTFDSRVSLNLQSGPATGGIFGKASLHAQNGVATFSNLTAYVAGSYKLNASAADLPIALAHKFAVAPTAAARIAFVSQPASEPAGLPLTFTVDVQDAFGNLITADDSTVSLSLFSGPVQLIYGTLTASAVGGQATFSNVILPTVGTYTLLATDASIGYTKSAEFNVTRTT